MVLAWRKIPPSPTIFVPSSNTLALLQYMIRFCFININPLIPFDPRGILQSAIIHQILVQRPYSTFLAAFLSFLASQCPKRAKILGIFPHKIHPYSNNNNRQALDNNSRAALLPLNSSVSGWDVVSAQPMLSSSMCVCPEDTRGKDSN